MPTITGRQIRLRDQIQPRRSFGPDKVNHAHHALIRARHFLHVRQMLEDCTGPNWFRYSDRERETYHAADPALTAALGVKQKYWRY